MGAGFENSVNEEVEVARFEDVDLSLTYSYANYLRWVFNERVELIKGRVFPMSAPQRLHQEVSREIMGALYIFLKGKPCQVYSAPFDVRFPKGSTADKDIYTVLQPDICVVCDTSKLDYRGCIGAPDVVVEILSPGNSKTELLHKYKVYEEFGVKEYWVVSVADKTFLKYTLDDNARFQPSKLFTLTEQVTSSVLPGFILNLDEVFAQVLDYSGKIISSSVTSCDFSSNPALA